MVSVYPSDDANLIKNLTESIYAYSNTFSTQSKKKKINRNPIHEFKQCSKPSPEDENHTSTVIDWFLSLPTDLKRKAIFVHNPNLSSFLRQMFLKNLYSGQSEYAISTSLKEQPYSDNLDEYFYSRKKNIEAISPNDATFLAEKYVESIIRLTDIDEYLDSLTVEIENYTQFFESFIQITRQMAFKVPCRAYFDTTLKRWT